MNRILIITFVIICGIFYYLSLLQFDEEIIFIEKNPGETVKINIPRHKGLAFRYDWEQLAGKPIKINKNNNEGISFSLSNNDRGLQFVLKLSASNFLFTKEIKFNVYTKLIGKTNLLTTGLDTTCLSDEFGVFCWGRNHYGESQNIPENLKNPEVLKGASNFSCAVESGKVICWGESYEIPAMNNAYLLSSDGQTMSICAAHSDGVTCWGNRGTLHFPEVLDITSLIGGYKYICYVKNYKLNCLGDNPSPQLDFPQDISNVTQLSSGALHACALSNGTVHCWGDNSQKQLMTPKKNYDIVKISTSGYSTCALYKDRTATCWGEKHRVRLANRFLSSIKDATDIVLGGFSGCVIDQLELKCWDKSSPKKIINPSKISGYHNSFCYIADGIPSCFGANWYTFPESIYDKKAIDVSLDSSWYVCVKNDKIQCFHGRGTEREIPESVQNSDSFSLTNWHGCAIADDELICWGEDVNNILSKKPNTDAPFFTKSFGEFKDISSSCVIDKSGIHCWGDNRFGQSEVVELINPTEVDIAHAFVCAIDGNQVPCWGTGYMEVEIREAFPGNLLAPHSLEISSNGHVCVIDGEDLVCWGNGRYKAHVVPDFIFNPIDHAAGSHQHCAIDMNGLTCWGEYYRRFSREPFLKID